MSTGLVFEKMFEKALTEIGYDVIKDLDTKRNLLAIAEQVRPGRVQNVCEKLKVKTANLLTSKQIVDYVYGIDCVLAPCGLSDARRFGFDITSNPDAFEDKVRRAKPDFQMLWKALGLTRVSIVLFTTDETELGVGLIKAANLEALGEVIQSSVIYPMDESNDYVTSYVVDYDVAIKV